MQFKKGDLINIIIKSSGAKVKNVEGVLLLEEGDEGVYYSPRGGGFRTFKPYNEINKIELATQ